MSFNTITNDHLLKRDLDLVELQDSSLQVVCSVLDKSWMAELQLRVAVVRCETLPPPHPVDRKSYY